MASTPAVVGAIVVTAVVGYVAGTVHGSLYLQPKSIMDAFGLAVYAYLAYLLLPIVGAAVVAASGVSWRWPGLTVLILMVATAILLGFASLVGIGGVDGVPEEYMEGGIAGVLVAVALGALAGYGIGWLVRRSRQRLQAGWFCASCDLLNGPAVKTCRYCGTAKSGGVT